MSLNIIIGKSNSGKSKYIYNNILKEQNNKKVIVFVPPMSRIVAEKEYMHYTKDSHITNVKITTISKYIEDNIDFTDLYANKQYMSDVTKKMYTKKMIAKLDNDFKIFSKSKESNEFISMLCNYFNIFEQQNISLKEIEEKYSQEDFTKAKLKELVGIYEKIEKERKDRFIDTLDQFDFYINQIQYNNISKDLKIYFDSYNNFSKSELEYIKKMLSFDVEITITLNLDVASENTGIFSESYYTFNKLKKIAKQVNVKVNEVFLEKEPNPLISDIEHLSLNIFQQNKKYNDISKNVNIKLVNNPQEEIEYIAKDIKEKTKHFGAKYSDFTIYTNDIDNYNLIIKRVFEKHNIPVFLNIKYEVKNSNIARYISLLLELSIPNNNYQKTTLIIELLKTGLFDMPHSLISKFENYINEFDIKAYMFEKEFTKNNLKNDYQYNLEEINFIRINVINKIKEFTKKINYATTSKEITEVIYNYLKEENVIQLIKKQLENIEDVDIKIKQQQILKVIYQIMDNISIVSDKLSLQQYMELFNFALLEQATHSIPSMIDNVEVCDINKTRNLSKDYIYIIGVNEDSMPKLNDSDELFTENELELFNNIGIEIKKTKIDKMNMELFNIYLAINKCNKKLVFTVPSNKMAGESLRPSSIIVSIKNILNIQMVQDTKENKITDEIDFLKDYIYTIKNENNMDMRNQRKSFNES